MSRAKFDFSGYDPKEFRKKKEPDQPLRPIVKMEAEDCEIIVTDAAQDDFSDLEAINAKRSMEVLGKAKA